LSKCHYGEIVRKWKIPWESSQINAVVTGTSKGIGAGIAKALAIEGASVVVNYASSKEGADRVVKEITEKSGKAIAVQGDVSKQADFTRLFAETKKAYGKLNILVNNAGIYKFAPSDSITEELFHSQFDLNVLGLLLTTKEAVKLFGPEGGSIINISSSVSTILPPDTSVTRPPRLPSMRSPPHLRRNWVRGRFAH
jgi:3-oxoacyl-[acyl-carrier protein] reductase